MSDTIQDPHQFNFHLGVKKTDVLMSEGLFMKPVGHTLVD